MKTSIDVDERIWRAAKMRAARDGLALGVVVESLLKQWVTAGGLATMITEPVGKDNGQA